MGFLDPGMDYYEAITDGKSEAMLLKGRTEAARLTRVED